MLNLFYFINLLKKIYYINEMINRELIYHQKGGYKMTENKIFNFNEILKSRELYEQEKKDLYETILDNYAIRKKPTKIIIR